MTGREVVEVYAVGGNRGADYIKDAGDADTTGAILTLDDGTIAVVSNSRHNARGYDVRMEIHGFQDSIAVGLEDKLPLRSVEPGVSFPAGTPHDFFMDRFTEAYRAELTAFTEVVAGTRPSPCTVADALEADPDRRRVHPVAARAPARGDRRGPHRLTVPTVLVFRARGGLRRPEHEYHGYATHLVNAPSPARSYPAQRDRHRHGPSGLALRP